MVVVIVFMTVKSKCTAGIRSEQSAIFLRLNHNLRRSFATDMPVQADHPVRGGHHHVKFMADHEDGTAKVGPDFVDLSIESGGPALVQTARRLIKDEFDRIFGVHQDATAHACDAIMMPTTPGPAFRIGEKVSDPMSMYLEDIFTVGTNLAGLPGISIPAGFVEEDGVQLPVGVQLIGPALGESKLLRIASMLEAAG